MLKNASVYITLIAVILYTLGLNFYQGFLSVFGLEESMFPLTLDQTMFTGYISMVHMGVKPFLWLLTATEGALLVAYSVDSLLKRLPKEKASDEDVSKIETECGRGSTFVVGAERLFIYAIVVLLVFIGAILFSFTSTKAGVAAGKKYNEKIKRGGVASSAIFMKKSGKVFKGYNIISSPQQYAVMIDDAPTIFNMSNIEKILSNQDAANL